VTHWRRLGGASIALGLVLVAGTIGYVVLGFGVLDAAYQTVTTVSTVGFREVEPLSPAGQVFTMVLILVGVGAALYTFSVLIETFIEGRLNELLGRRRMEQSIAALNGHVVICGWGRVGKAIAEELTGAGRELVIVDSDASVVDGIGRHVVVGDATDDGVLRAAGIGRAAALVAAVDGDAANSFIVLGARALRPELFIVARARSSESVEKLRRAGADRVVNPQSIGGARMAAFVLRPHVAEFLDVVMRERSLEFRLDEIELTERSPIAGRSLRETQLRDRTGALVLAVRERDGAFRTNPPPDTRIDVGQVIIAIGTQQELDALTEYVG
jgi:voltage-gated potassium channel